MRRFVLLLVAGLLAGCVNQRAQRDAYLSQFIGQPESTLVQAMGVPARSIEAGGVKYLAYSEHKIDVVPGTPIYGPWPYGWYGGGLPPQVVEWNCETTFAVADGKVTNYTLRGNACG
jgi:hypothetical protein